MVALWRSYAKPKGRCTAVMPKQALEVARRGMTRTALVIHNKKAPDGALYRFALLIEV